MSTTDALQLNKSEMFAKVRAGLPEERQHTQNLLECKDDLLYAWDSKESCLLALNWRAAQTKGFQAINYQCLMPSSPQSFQVERLLASNEGSLIALAGPRGLAVLELPRRWGQNGLFMAGKEKITCRSSNLDAHFFSNNPHLELRQIRWHPASPTDSHLLVLLSDNTIRVYDNATLRHVWPVGPVPLKGDTNPNNSSLSAVLALGESAVDFDLAPAVPVTDSTMLAPLNAGREPRPSQAKSSFKALNESTASTKSTAETVKVEWPIVVLRENGNIYVLMAGMDSDKPRLQGPLTITPQTVTNYGLDSCAILIIPSLPPTLIIAESNGKLHHALLLEAEAAEDSFNEIDSSLLIHPSEWSVHVLESVELELGLPKVESMTSYNCPIHLKRDYINELRYFAYHNTGLHVVTINFIGELQRYLESDVSSDVASLANPSRAEYIVCTKIDSGERTNAVLGFVLHQMPSGVLLLLASGQLISLKLIIDPQLLMTPTEHKTAAQLSDNAETQAQLTELMAPSFVDHIKNMLKRTVTQPILSLDKTATPRPQESYELLTQALEVLRTQYLQRHELVRAEFSKRVNTIRLRKEQQRRDIDYLEQQREDIREQAHRLAERFEEISEQQELLTRRCQDLMRQANTCLPSNTIAEQEFAQEVERINKATKSMTMTLHKSRENINKQWYHITKYNETAKLKAFELPEKQERTIKEILLQMNAEIDGQIKEIKRIGKIVNI